MKSIAFLVPIKHKDGGIANFEKHFIDLGYECVFISDHYGLRGKDPFEIARWLIDLDHLCKQFKEKHAIDPKLVLDIKGFFANSDSGIRDFLDNAEWCVGYHVTDEPDSHGKYGSTRPDLSPDEIENDILKGTLNRPYSKPLWITFEKQFAGFSRQWNYRVNTNEFYLEYIRMINRWHAGKNYFGIDYYTFMLTVNNEVTHLDREYEIIANIVPLVHAGGGGHPFVWTETVFQGLNYLCRRPGYVPQAMTPDQLWAVIWLHWVGGQTGIRGDFNYIFEHLCQGKKTWDWDGLNHEYYSQSKEVVKLANTIQSIWDDFLDRPNIPVLTTDPRVKASLRFTVDNMGFKCIIMAVNMSPDGIPGVGLLTHPVLSAFHFEDRMTEEEVEVYDNGFIVQQFDPYDVKLIEWVDE